MCSIMGYCGKGCDPQAFTDALEKTHSRGPDAARVLDTGNGYLGFNRLSIMGLTKEGMQPFITVQKNTILTEPEGNALIINNPSDNWDTALVCNGEIYGFRVLKKELEEKGYHFISDSDCEILPALYREYGTDMFAKLDAEYALILFDRSKN